MIDAETLKDLMSIKLEAKKAASTSIWRPLASFGMQRLTDEEVWQRFVEAGDAGLSEHRLHHGDDEWLAYMDTLARIAPDGMGRRLVAIMKERHE
jgi:hypothetical protein